MPARCIFRRSLPLLHQYEPRSVSDLAVHPAKIKQLFRWFNDYGHQGRILLLIGPSGCGKSAALRIICAQLNLHTIEWTNCQQSELGFSDQAEFRLNDVPQKRQFADFLRRSDYGNLLTSNDGCVVLVEELPHAFYRTPSLLHSVLDVHCSSFRRPLIFIISDVDSSTDIDRKHLFPDEVISRLKIDEIAFNSTAESFLVKALERIADLHGQTSLNSAKLKQRLKIIAESSDGDIRSAIYKLQMALNSDNSIQLDNNKSELVSFADYGLLFFHALGKLLYAKREHPSIPYVEPYLPTHLYHLTRPIPLKSEPISVVDLSHSNSNKLTNFLHENILDFLADDNFQAMTTISDDFSQFDSSSHQWEVRERINDVYGGLICAMSVSFWNCNRKKTLGFHQIRKPKWKQIQKDLANSLSLCLNAFEDRRCFWSPESLVTSLLPFLSLVNMHGMDEIKRMAISSIYSEWNDNQIEINSANLNKSLDLAASDISIGSFSDQESI